MHIKFRIKIWIVLILFQQQQQRRQQIQVSAELVGDTDTMQFVINSSIFINRNFRADNMTTMELQNQPIDRPIL